MRTSTTILLSLAAAMFAAPCGAAPETAWRSAQGFEGALNQCRLGALAADAVPAVQGRLVPQAQDDGLIRILSLSTLPAPDGPTKKWLASRIPGLDTAALKSVPAWVEQRL